MYKRQFRTSAWFILAALLVGYSQWSQETYVRVAQGAVVVALVVGAYALLHKVIGTTATEYDYALQITGVIPSNETLRFFGSLLLLLAGLSRRAAIARDPPAATLGIGAAGVLTGMLVLFYLGLYIEGLGALAGWILVGLGISQFATLPAPTGAAAEAPPSPLSAAPAPVAAR